MSATTDVAIKATCMADANKAIVDMVAILAMEDAWTPAGSPAQRGHGRVGVSASERCDRPRCTVHGLWDSYTSGSPMVVPVALSRVDTTGLPRMLVSNTMG